MREVTLLLSNYFFITLTMLLLANLQCSLWLQIFGHFPAPNLWLPVLAYTSIYRSFPESLIYAYLMTAVLAPLTALPFGILLSLNLLVAISLQLTKNRIYWPGSTYFMILCGVASIAFPVAELAFSWVVENNPISDFLFFDWVIKALLTMLATFPIYFVLHAIDRKTKKEWPAEIGSFS